MQIEKMLLDTWDGPRCEETSVAHPTWENVECSLRQLDANRHTCLSLLGRNDLELVIGGGSGQFVCVASPDEDTHLTALDLSKQEEEIELTVGGQTGLYTAQMICDEETALCVAKEFCETNTLASRLNWTQS